MRTVIQAWMISESFIGIQWHLHPRMDSWMIKYTVLIQIEFVIAHLIVDDCIYYYIQKGWCTLLYHKFCFRSGWLGKPRTVFS